VDYPAIYRYLGDILIGEIPPQLNDATSRKILQMMGHLRETNAEAQPHIKEEKSMLERYTVRDVALLSENLTDKSTDPKAQFLCSLPGINLFSVTPALITKKVLRKSTSL
jgi:hypothetical protein